MSKLPKYILVTSLSPRGDEGGFTRAGIRFLRGKWRLLELGTTEQRDANGHLQGHVINETTYKALTAESMLSTKPADENEAALHLKEIAEGPRDKDAELAALKKHAADLEARLMRLETKQPETQKKA